MTDGGTGLSVTERKEKGALRCGESNPGGLLRACVRGCTDQLGQLAFVLENGSQT